MGGGLATHRSVCHGLVYVVSADCLFDCFAAVLNGGGRAANWPVAGLTDQHAGPSCDRLDGLRAHRRDSGRRPVAGDRFGDRGSAGAGNGAFPTGLNAF